MAEPENWKEKAATAYQAKKAEADIEATRKARADHIAESAKKTAQDEQDARTFAPLLQQFLGIETRAYKAGGFDRLPGRPISSGREEIDGVTFVLMPAIDPLRTSAGGRVSQRASLSAGVGMEVACPDCGASVKVRLGSLADVGQYLAGDFPDKLPGHKCPVSTQ